MSAWIDKERYAALQDGKFWTDPRPFKYKGEKWGKFFCRSTAHRGKRPAVAVSYATTINGCVVYCKQCFEKCKGDKG